MKKIIKAIVSIGMLVPMVVMASPAHTNVGNQVNASKCNTGGSLIVNITFKVINDDDSGTAGNAWAKDSINRRIQIWDQGDGTFCAIAKYEGQFVTNAGASPGNTGVLSAGVKGTFDGGYRAILDGTFNPTLKTNGNLGTMNYMCDGSFNCPGAFDWVEAYFDGNTLFNQDYWAWNYRGGKNGSWLNASTGNLGDITGN